MRERGFQIAELLVALVIGLALLAAFISALSQCRALFATHESIASLQDSSRHVLSVIVPDVEHAGFHGFTNAPAARIAGALPAGANDCWPDIGNLTPALRGSNNSFVAGPSAAACAPTATAAGARPGADSLAVRHAALPIATPRAGRVQLYSRRLASQEPVVFADGRAPGAVDRDREIRDLDVHIYYVANSSVGRAGWPALRVKSLTESGGAAQYRDEEVLPGVEDLQIEFGIASIVDGGRRLRFVTADSPALAGDRVVAVRLWLRIRADVTEPGYRDQRPLDYADVHFAPTPLEARQRRLLIERTIAVRNVH